MNSTNAAAYLPLVKALAEGKTIQLRPPSPLSTSDWADLADTTWSQPVEQYRIKPPEPKLRAWTISTCPIGAIIRSSVLKDVHCLIVTASHKGITVVDNEAKFFPYASLIRSGEYSIDGGKTWSKCGIMEDSQ